MQKLNFLFTEAIFGMALKMVQTSETKAKCGSEEREETGGGNCSQSSATHHKIRNATEETVLYRPKYSNFNPCLFQL